MQIRFETTIDDVLAFRRQEFQGSPPWAWRVVWPSTTLAAIMAGVFVTFMINFQELFGRFFFWVLFAVPVLGVAYSILYPMFAFWIWDRKTRKSMIGAAGRAMLGWRELELIDGYLLVKTEMTECRLDMRAIEKIFGDGDRMFVCVAAGPTFIIPLNQYPEHLNRQFVAELRETWENGFAGPPTEIRAARLPKVDDRIEELR